MPCHHMGRQGTVGITVVRQQLQGSSGRMVYTDQYGARERIMESRYPGPSCYHLSLVTLCGPITTWFYMLPESLMLLPKTIRNDISPRIEVSLEGFII